VTEALNLVIVNNSSSSIGDLSLRVLSSTEY